MLNNGNNKLVKKSVGEKILYGSIFVFFILYSVILIFPYVWGLVSSIKTPLEYYNPFDLPKSISFSNYAKAVTSMSVENITIGDMTWNSIWFTFGSVIISTECHSLGGYVLSKFHIKGRRLIMMIIMIPILVPVFGAFPASYNHLHQALSTSESSSLQPHQNIVLVR